MSLSLADAPAVLSDGALCVGEFVDFVLAVEGRAAALPGEVEPSLNWPFHVSEQAVLEVPAVSWRAVSDFVSIFD